MKSKLLIFSVALSLFFGSLAFLVAWNFYIALAVFVLFFLTFDFLISPLIEAYAAKERKRHEAYRFVNGFLITLSVTLSPENAYASATGEAKGELSELVSRLSSSSVDERLEYLKGYFLESYYAMFVSVFHLYEEQGGDVLSLSESLLKETARKEEEGDALQKESIRKLVEFVSLWLLSVVIIVFVRICLRTFYGSLVRNPLYLGCLGLYFLIAIVSFVLFTSVFTAEKVSVKGGLHVPFWKKKKN